MSKQHTEKIKVIKPILLIAAVLAICVSMLIGGLSSAQERSSEPVQQKATGLQGTIPSPPPTTAATISQPANGRTFTETPVEVSGLCTTGLLVKIFSNNIFVGAVQCESGSYSIQIDLFSGENALVARVFDALDQAGPDSNTSTVTFQDATFSAFAQRVSLTSNLAKNGANVGTQLVWPIVISGGTGPYAISVDWGDGSAIDLKSIANAGSFDIAHIYKTAGIYRVIVKATDANGVSAYLQLVGVGNGEASQNGDAAATGSQGGSGAGEVRYIYIWWPVLLLIPFILVAFWIGRRYEGVAIRRRVEKQAMMYQSEIQR